MLILLHLWSTKYLQPEEACRHKSIHLPSASIIRSAHRKFEWSGAEDAVLFAFERTKVMIIMSQVIYQTLHLYLIIYFFFVEQSLCTKAINGHMSKSPLRGALTLGCVYNEISPREGCKMKICDSDFFTLKLNFVN